MDPVDAAPSRLVHAGPARLAVLFALIAVVAVYFPWVGSISLESTADRIRGAQQDPEANLKVALGAIGLMAFAGRPGIVLGGDEVAILALLGAGTIALTTFRGLRPLSTRPVVTLAVGALLLGAASARTLLSATTLWALSGRAIWPAWGWGLAMGATLAGVNFAVLALRRSLATPAVEESVP